MSALELRRACVRMLLVNRAYVSPQLPHRQIALFAGEEVKDVNHVLLLPGGERIIFVKKDGALEMYDIASKNVISRVMTTVHDGQSRLRQTIHVRNFPTSIHSGYLVVDGRHDWSRWSPHSPRQVTLDVYRYGERVLQHVVADEIEETRSPSVLYEDYGFCAYEGSLHLVHIRRASPLFSPNMTRSFEMRSRVVDSSGNRLITKQSFLAASFENDAQNNATENALYVLSPRYVLIGVQTSTKVVFELFDLRQVRDNGEPTTIFPIWSSPSSLNICAIEPNPPRVTSCCVDGRTPSVRVCFKTYAPGAFYFLDLPALHDISIERGLSLSRIRLPEGTPDDAEYVFMDRESDEYGLLLLYDYTQRYSSFPDAECLRSFAAPWWIEEHSADDDTPQPQAGLAKLEESDVSNVLTLRFGNTSMPFEESTHCVDQYSVDDVSGRFTSFTQANVYIGGRRAGIVLHTLDNELE